MAKGFKVQAAAPSVPKDDFDLDRCRSEIKGKKIVFCLPGRGCSYTFLKNFVQLCFDIVQAGGSIQISQDYSSMVNFARCKVLGANVLRGKNQIPWDGKLEYDYQLWIDNDIVFNTESFYRLFQLALDKEIAAGKPFTCDYTGFGWVLIKKGVFENLPYPWFAPQMQVFESGEVQDMCGEDVSFCLDAKKEGYEIWCDPRIRVGHEKMRVL